MKIRAVTSGYFLMAMLIGSAAAVADVMTDRVVTHSTPNNAPRALSYPGKNYFAYYDERNRLLMTADGKGKPVVIADGNKRAKNSYNGAFAMDDHLYFIWRPKLTAATPEGGRPGDKHLMFRASYDGGKTFSAPVRLDSGNGAFHPHPLLSDGEGNLYLTWLDERDGGKNYGVFLNISRDHGRHWLKHDIRMTGKDAHALDPFMAVDHQNLWLGWTEFDPEKGTMILKIRTSQNGGRKWSEEKIIPTPEGQVISPRIMKVKEKLLLFYYMPKHGILLTTSSDGGSQWNKPVILPGTKDKGSNGFHPATDGKANLCLVWPGPARLGKITKADIYASCTHDLGESWDPLKRLDTNTPNFTHSLLPDIAMDKDGRVIVVWQDSRDIRPHIYASYSLDGGRNWLEHDVRISPEGRRFSLYPDLLSLNKGEFAVVWEEQKTDSPEGGYLLAYERFGLSECLLIRTGKQRKICPQKTGVSEQMNDRKKRLLEREKQFWKHYINRDFDKAYEMFDPFVRQQLNVHAFIGNINRFNYLEARVSDDAEITENYGKISVTVTVEAPNLGVIKGKKVRLDRAEKTFDETWIWIDGDWFKVYELANGNYLPM